MKNTRRSVKLPMQPEWNPAQSVQVHGETVLAAASPYDVPDSFSLETDGANTTFTLSYDFNAREKATPAPSTSKTVKVFRGESSGRVMRIEIEASADHLDAVKVILEKTVNALRDLALQVRGAEPIRRAVHLGMLEQALPMMEPEIEASLKGQRRVGSRY